MNDSTSSTAEVPDLRPIETPTNGDGSSSFFSSPTNQSISSPSSDKHHHHHSSAQEFVLPHHKSSNGGGTATGNGALFRRIRTTLASPFKSPLGGKYYEEENILMQAASASGGRRGPRHQRNGASRSYRNVALVMCGLCAVGVWALSGKSSGGGGDSNDGVGAKIPLKSVPPSPQTPFTFRPYPIEGTPSADAIDLYRQAYDTTGDEDLEEPYIGMDDPLNPGSIFVVLDLLEEANENNAAADNNFINRNGELFAKMKEFDLGLKKYLMGNFTPSRRPNSNNEDGGEDEEYSTGAESTTAPPLIDVTSFYTLLSDNLPHIAGSYYATPDGFTTLMEIKFTVPSEYSQSTESVEAYTKTVVGAIKSHVSASLPSGVTAKYTGLPLFQMDLRPTSSRPALMGASLDDLLSPTAPSLKAYHNLADRFGWGVVSPYKIVFDHSDEESSMDTDPGFRLMHKIMAAFAQVDLENETNEEEVEEEIETIAGLAAVNLDSIPQRIEDGHMSEHLSEVMDELYGVHPIIPNDAISSSAGRRASKPPTRTVYNGVAFLRNNQVPYPLYLGAKICREKQHHHCNLELLHYFTAMTDAMTSKDRMTTYISATLGVDPFSQYGIAWLMAARKKIREMEINGDLDGYRVNIVGGAALEYDAWVKAQTEAAAASTAAGGGMEPPTSSSSSSPAYIYYIAVSALVLFASITIIRSLASGSKHRAYVYKKN